MLRRLQAALLRTFGLLPRPVRRAAVRLVAPKFTVGGLCVVERADGRILLVRQSYRQHWGLPGGLLHRREAPGDGARREVLEEVGLRVQLVGEPAVVVNPRTRLVDVVYRAAPVDGTASDDLRPRSAEIVEVRWFPADALPDLQVEASSALVALARSRRR